MINRESIMAQRAKQEQLRKEKEKIVKVKKEAFDVEAFKQKIETRELDDINFTDEVLKKKRITPSGKPGAIRLIYSNNGKKMNVGKDVYSKLEEPKTLQCGSEGEYLYLGETLKEGAVDYPVRFSQNSPVIYSAKLVEDAIINFDLEYDGCVCKTFYDVEYFISKETNKMVAKIRISEYEQKVDAEGGNLNEA